MKSIHSLSSSKALKTLFLSAVFAISMPVFAMNLQQAMSALPNAKTQGLVGEQPNGYLGVVQNSPEAESIAKLINDARRAEYTRLAKENNIAVADVEAMAGQKAVECTSRGHYILLDGKWLQKR
ncbi:YdbL family protein [Alishewanella longhuensis]